MGDGLAGAVQLPLSDSASLSVFFPSSWTSPLHPLLRGLVDIVSPSILKASKRRNTVKEGVQCFWKCQPFTAVHGWSSMCCRGSRSLSLLVSYNKSKEDKGLSSQKDQMTQASSQYLTSTPWRVEIFISFMRWGDYNINWMTFSFGKSYYAKGSGPLFFSPLFSWGEWGKLWFFTKLDNQPDLKIFPFMGPCIIQQLA